VAWLTLVLGACGASLESANTTANNVSLGTAGATTILVGSTPAITITITNSSTTVEATSSSNTSVVNPSQGQHLLFVEPDDSTPPILNALASAKSSIEMKMYLLTEREVINALEAAQQRGVKVRVMLEEHPYGSGTGNTEVYKTLQNTGISVKWTSPAFQLTHEKSLVIDDRTALIMTLNLTHAALVSNREYGIITYTPAEVQEVEDGFNADWERVTFNPKNSASSALLWSNLNSRQKILAFIDGAQKSLVLEQEEMQDSEIEQHLVAAVKRGVKVRVLVAAGSGSDQDGNLAGEQQVKAGSGQVKTITAPYMHAKIYLADNNRVIICSENVSTASLNLNRELGIIVSDAAIVKRVAQTFEKDWALGRSL
jgi:phosphatidylserine/phosphatidylglycerophosphate/cardiolipin synthase-like enzyme